MAEDPNVEQEAEEKSSPLVKNIVIFGIVLLVPMILAVLVFNVFIKSRISDEEKAQATPEVVDPFPPTMVEVIFDEQQVSVRTEDPDMVAPLLLTQVTLMCRDPATAELVGARKSIFAAMILEFHQGRTRSELNDSLVKNSILEQIKQQANILLRRLSPEEDLMVLDALHLKYTIVDL